MGQKNAKGTVSIENFRGRIRLRWRFQTKRYSVNLNEYKKANLLAARKTTVQIEQDILNNAFEFTLRKYSGLKASPLVISKTIVEYFEEWVTNYRQMDCNKNCDYYIVFCRYKVNAILVESIIFNVLLKIRLYTNQDLLPRQ